MNVSGLIKGTPIVVDSFKSYGKHARFYFLTHFHTDHIEGLSNNWTKGVIFCSGTTKGLILYKFPDIVEDRIVTLEEGESKSINLDEVGEKAFTVVALNANHMPGSFSYVFEGYFGLFLHTGDFRYYPDFLDSRILQSRVVDRLYLDTTYCREYIKFPSRESCLADICTFIDETSGDENQVLILLTRYGKEELIVNIAMHYNTKIAVSKEKMEVLEIMGFQRDLFTLDDTKTRFKVADLRKYAEWSNFLKRKKTLMVIPSNFEDVSNVFLKELSRMIGHDIIKKKFHYSSHSSFQELTEFVQRLQPKSIFPLVSSGYVREVGLPILKKRANADADVHFDVPESVKEATNIPILYHEEGDRDKGIMESRQSKKPVLRRLHTKSLWKIKPNKIAEKKDTLKLPELIELKAAAEELSDIQPPLDDVEMDETPVSSSQDREYCEIVKDIDSEQNAEVVYDINLEQPPEIDNDISSGQAAEEVEEVFSEQPAEVVEEIFSEQPAEVVEEVFSEQPAEVVEEVFSELPAEVVEEIFSEQPAEVVEEIFSEQPSEVVEEVFSEQPAEGAKEDTSPVITPQMPLPDEVSSFGGIEKEISQEISDVNEEISSIDESDNSGPGTLSVRRKRRRYSLALEVLKRVKKERNK